MSGMAESVVNAVIGGTFIAGTYKILSTKQRSFGQVMSMDTLKEGGKLATSVFIYDQVGKPLVARGQKAIGGVVSSATA